ncbi:hypothetical protein [Croceimicrobium hydrocarbonivorans]|uniref:Uncharacterized protein n=1 Tax=Croceimicrobium hydrocarbonivorans TaxID=2761580 RepID=A0A7H0VBA2_9FLAO|nr:hypothetical protein [Croceimicrobium hydrocarbonivorans]QNR22957.1 hypothetical protein H4K34_11265 [Croceimicrobium hydrocarbonivorans]QNR23000.1 hypothetical protein H4K34_11480 [Croceimicrobium hydrocarbonivorans]
MALAAFGYYFFFLPARKRAAELKIVEAQAEGMSADAATQLANLEVMQEQAKLARKANQTEKARRNALVWFETEYNPRLRNWLRAWLWTKPTGKDYYRIHDQSYMNWLNKNLAEAGVKRVKDGSLGALPLGWTLTTNGQKPGKEILVVPTPTGNISVVNPQTNYPQIQLGVTPK